MLKIPAAAVVVVEHGLAAFGAAMRGGTHGNVRLARDFINSTIYTGGSLVTNTLLGTMAGYALARLRVPVRTVLFALVLAAMTMPLAAIVIPRFLIVRVVSAGGGTLGRINTIQGLILPSAVMSLTSVLGTSFCAPSRAGWTKRQ